MFASITFSRGVAPHQNFDLGFSTCGDDKLRTTVHLPNIAPIGAKLRQNAFQTICNFRFFDAEKNFRPIFFSADFFVGGFSVVATGQKKKNSGAKKLKIANRLKRVLPKFGGERSYVWEVNGRSKFVIAVRFRDLALRCWYSFLN